MIVEFDTFHNDSGHTSPTHRQQRSETQFATLMANAYPLFSPWPAVDQAIRSNPPSANASLSAHPTSSNRREGRHARE